MRIIALAAALLIAVTHAHAATYNFTATSGTPISRGPQDTRPPLPAGETIATLNIDDSVVAQGSVKFTVNCSDSAPGGCPDPWPPYITGSGILEWRIPAPTADLLPYAVSLTFNPDGTLTGSIRVIEELSELLIGGSEYNWAGIIGGDLEGNFNIAGYWLDPDPMPISEPSSLPLMLLGLGAMIAAGVRAGMRETRAQIHPSGCGLVA
jgi:hypothetical protein